MAIDLNGAADDRRITAELRLPEGVTEHGNGAGTGGGVLVSREHASHGRNHAEDAEIVRGDVGHPNANGPTVAGKSHRLVMVPEQSDEAGVLALEIEQVGI